MKTFIASTAIFFAATFCVSAIAAADHGEHAHMQSHAATQMQMADGLVKKMDKAAGKVTLAHGPLVNLGMSAMTMAFPVKDAAWLDRLKEGDKIRFMADKLNGVITIIQIEAAK